MGRFEWGLTIDKLKGNSRVDRKFLRLDCDDGRKL